MLKFFLFFLLVFLIFCPIKLKLKILATEKDLQIYLYKYRLFSLIDLINKKKENQNEKSKYNDTVKKETEKIRKEPKKNRKLKIDSRKLMSTLYYNKFKPSLRFQFNIKYSTEDAALTALLFGFIHQGTSILHLILDSLFKLNFFSKGISPEFNDINLVLFKIESIITISFAQIIYITILYFIKK